MGCGHFTKAKSDLLAAAKKEPRSATSHEGSMKWQNGNEMAMIYGIDFVKLSPTSSSTLSPSGHILRILQSWLVTLL